MIEPILTLEPEDGVLDSRAENQGAAPATRAVGSNQLKTFAVGEPRIDTDSATGEPLGLLLEPEQRNLLSDSTNAWNSSYSGRSIVSDTDEIPRRHPGTIVSKLECDSSGPASSDFRTSIYGSLEINGRGTSAVVTVSCWYYPLHEFPAMLKVNAYGDDLSASQIASSGQQTYETGRWHRLWTQYKCTTTAHSLDAGDTWMQVPVVDAKGGNDGQFFYVTCPQVEKGQFLTSYVPSSGDEKARSDRLVTPEAFSFDEGVTVVADYRLDQQPRRSADFLQIGEDFAVRLGGVPGGHFKEASFWELPTGDHTVAYAASDTGAAQVVDGQKVTEQSRSSSSALSGQLTVNANAPMWLRSLRVYPQRLSDADLRQLTHQPGSISLTDLSDETGPKRSGVAVASFIAGSTGGSPIEVDVDDPNSSIKEVIFTELETGNQEVVSYSGDYKYSPPSDGQCRVQLLARPSFTGVSYIYLKGEIHVDSLDFRMMQDLERVHVESSNEETKVWMKGELAEAALPDSVDRLDFRDHSNSGTPHAEMPARLFAGLKEFRGEAALITSDDGTLKDLTSAVVFRAHNSKAGAVVESGPKTFGSDLEILNGGYANQLRVSLDHVADGGSTNIRQISFKQSDTYGDLRRILEMNRGLERLYLSGYTSDLSGTLSGGEPVMPPTLEFFAGGSHTSTNSFFTDWTNAGNLTECKLRGSGDLTPVLQGMIDAIDPAGDGSETGLSLGNLSFQVGGSNNHNHGQLKEYCAYDVYDELIGLTERPEFQHSNWSPPVEILSYTDTEVVVRDPGSVVFTFFDDAVDFHVGGPGWAQRPEINLTFLDGVQSRRLQPLDSRYGDGSSLTHTASNSSYGGAETTTFPLDGSTPSVPLLSNSTLTAQGDQSYTQPAA